MPFLLVLCAASGCSPDPSGLDAPTASAPALLSADVTTDASAAARRVHRYSVTLLGTLGGDYSIPVRINERAQIAGYSTLVHGSDALPHAFLWEHGRMRDLGALGDYSIANDLNQRGQVAGRSRAPDGTTHAIVWDHRLIDLGTLGGSFSEAVALNNRGQVAGYSHLAGDTDTHAFLWHEGTLLDLGAFGGSGSYATGINERGEVIGNYVTAAGDLHCFLWRDGRVHDLGTFGGNLCTAGAINDRGQVVGQARTANNEDHAFLWERGHLVDLGTLGGKVSQATRINEFGVVIGRSLLPTGGDPDGFVWKHGRMVDLDPGHVFRPSAINEFSVIVGDILSRTESGAFVWDDGVLTPLPGNRTFASDLNNRGQIAGAVQDADKTVATLFQPEGCER